MEVKRGYKQTEVGVIPEDWECVESGAMATYFGGNAFKSEVAASDGVRWLKITNVGKQRAQWTDVSYLPHSYATAFKDYMLQEGDVVMALTRPILDNELKIAKLTELDVPSLLNQRVAKVIARSRADLNFIYYVLQTRHFVDSMNESMAGTDPPNIGSRALGRIPIAAPPTIDEQRAIAGALSDVDALIGALDSALAKKRDIKQAAMQQLLTGQKRLPGFRGEWKVKRLGEIGDITGSGVDKKSRPDETPVRLVNYLDVYRRDFIYSDDLNHWVTAPPHQARRCAVQKGDVFFTPSSETRDDIGFSAVAMEDIPDAAYSYHVVRLRLKQDWDLRFRTYAFKTRAFLDQAETLCDGSGTRYVISQGKFRSMTVKVPPLPEQTAIAEVLSDMDAELAALEQRRDKTRALKQGMMQELLTGRIRLV